MTDEELAAIAERVRAWRKSPDAESFTLKMDARALLIEVERLRTENDALTLMGLGVTQAYQARIEGSQRSWEENDRLRAIIAQVIDSDAEHGEGARCHFCGWTPHISRSHAPDCKRDEARALFYRGEDASQEP